MREHEWMSMEGQHWEFCRVCGVVKRADGTNKPCPGPVKVTTREGARMDA